MSNFDENEFKEIIESGHGSEKKESDHRDNQPEKRCYICGRPESETGPLMHIPNQISICKDCMQK